MISVVIDREYVVYRGSELERAGRGLLVLLPSELGTHGVHIPRSHFGIIATEPGGFPIP